MQPKSKKITMVIYNLQAGGAERVLSTLANYFCKQNNIAVQMLFIWDEVQHYFLDPRVHLECIDPQVKNMPLPLACAKRVQFIRKKALEFQSDVVISFLTQINMYACLAVQGTNIKLITSERNDPNSPDLKHWECLTRNFIYHNFAAHKTVFQTQYAKECFNDKIQKNAIVIANPLAENLPFPSFENKRNAIAAVGRLEPQKNYSLLLNAFAKANVACDLEIYGQGSQKQQLQTLCQRLGIAYKVKFMGVQPEVPQKIKDCLGYVLASDYEGMPNSLMEAMAIGLACISTDCPAFGPRQLITTDKNGILVPVGDMERLTQSIKNIILDTEFAKNMGKEAANSMQKYQIEIIGNQWLSLIDEILTH